MAFRACLLDVYDTVLTCDYDRMVAEIRASAGIDGEVWRGVVGDLGPAVTDGRLSLAGMYEEIIRRSGRPVSTGIVQELVDRDYDLLRESARLFDETVPALQLLRGRGVRTAFVSNCAENTRLLLDELDLIRLVDAVVLSCEVGAAKPDPPIFEHALRQLGVPAAESVFVDDQRGYCDGAAALGIHAVRICRDRGEAPGGHEPTISSLTDLDALF
jgi:putative hydrolase of the HAD superfamily